MVIAVFMWEFRGSECACELHVSGAMVFACTLLVRYYFLFSLLSS